MPTDIGKKVKAIVADQMSIPPDDIGRETSFIRDLHTDSLDTVELVIGMEQAFDVTISDDDVRGLQTVGDVVDYISDQTKTTD